MQDVLLEINSAASREVVKDTSYRWSNAGRGGRAAILQFTWSGCGNLRRGRKPVVCGPGQALLMLHGRPTEYYFPRGAGEPWIFSWVNFTGAEEVCEHMIRTHGDVVNLDPIGETVGLLEETARRFWEKGFEDRYEVSDFLGRMLAALGRELARGGGRRREPADLARDYLRDHHRRPINVKEVAARLGHSREHLTRMFCEKTGGGPAQFLRRLRLATARRLLRGTALAVEEVAGQSGFGSATHFSRAFRAAYGMTPSEFRAGSEPG